MEDNNDDAAPAPPAPVPPAAPAHERIDMNDYLNDIDARALYHWLLHEKGCHAIFVRGRARKGWVAYHTHGGVVTSGNWTQREVLAWCIIKLPVLTSGVGTAQE